jgi:hypothetical protein
LQEVALSSKYEHKRYDLSCDAPFFHSKIFYQLFKLPFDKVFSEIEGFLVKSNGITDAKNKFFKIKKFDNFQ